MFKKLLLCGVGYAGFKAAQHCIKYKKEDKAVDIASDDSFPASDPPASNQFTEI